MIPPATTTILPSSSPPYSSSAPPLPHLSQLFVILILLILSSDLHAGNRDKYPAAWDNTPITCTPESAARWATSRGVEKSGPTSTSYPRSEKPDAMTLIHDCDRPDPSWSPGYAAYGHTPPQILIQIVARIYILSLLHFLCLLRRHGCRCCCRCPSSSLPLYCPPSPCLSKRRLYTNPIQPGRKVRALTISSPAPDPDICPSGLVTQNFSRGSPLWENSCSSLETKIARGPPLVGVLCGDGLLWLPLRRAPNPDWCPSAPARQNVSRGSPYGRICTLALEKKT